MVLKVIPFYPGRYFSQSVHHLEGHALSRSRAPGPPNNSAPLPHITYRGPRAAGRRLRGRGTPESRTPYARRSRSPTGLRTRPSLAPARPGTRLGQRHTPAQPGGGREVTEDDLKVHRSAYKWHFTLSLTKHTLSWTLAIQAA